MDPLDGFLGCLNGSLMDQSIKAPSMDPLDAVILVFRVPRKRDSMHRSARSVLLRAFSRAEDRLVLLGRPTWM